MKKILCVLMIALMLMGTASAEDFSLWHGLRFGMTRNEILKQFDDITEMMAHEKKCSVKPEPFFRDPELVIDVLHFPITEKEYSAIMFVEIAEIPNVIPYFGFDDNGGLKHLVFKYDGRPTVSEYGKAQNKRTYSAYDSLVSRLKVKYGDAEPDNRGLPSYEDGITFYINNYDRSPEINDSWIKESTKWLVNIDDGNCVLIRCAYYEKTILGVIDSCTAWSYSYISKSEIEDSLSIYNDL